MKTTSVFWQPALQAPGEIVRGLDDIRQSIQIILRTPRGSDPHRPEFGSNLHLYIDW
ncbi:TPA: baseplate protein, partial [Escherichia coli]|nr:baseplate protein [Escherichia coli]